jgi:hypothetical protein
MFVSPATMITKLKKKVFGAPLQSLYRRLIKLQKAPQQPEIIRTISTILENKGVHYHSRTIKRQLLGNIEYIPESLEETLVDWLKNTPQNEYQSLLAQFRKDKESLENSHDKSLYVSPQNFIRMADAYLYLNKISSRRRLAVRLNQDLKKKNISMGLETLQSALAGKTQKIKKILEDELRGYFVQESFSTSENFIEELALKAIQEVQKVEVKNIPKLVDDYLLKTEGISRRKLAMLLKDRLTQKGYTYHLSSIQSILEGKTKKTRKIVLQTLIDLFKSKVFEEPGPSHVSIKGRPSIANRVLAAYDQFLHAQDKDLKFYHQVFLKLRSELIRKVWLKKHPKFVSKSIKEPKKLKSFFEDFSEERSPPNHCYNDTEPQVAYDVEIRLDRLVS